MIALPDSIFKITPERLHLYPGQILVADPFVRKSYFNHAVMTIVDHNDAEGPTGVILNIRSRYLLHELMPELDADTQIPVYCGGPSGQDRLYFIHTLGPRIIPGGREFAPGLYVGGDFDAAVQYVSQGYPTEGCIRFFLGYAYWSDGELEKGLTDEKWAESFMDTDEYLTDYGDAVWHRAVKHLGLRFRSWSLIPRNASCN